MFERRPILHQAAKLAQLDRLLKAENLFLDQKTMFVRLAEGRYRQGLILAVSQLNRWVRTLLLKMGMITICV